MKPSKVSVRFAESSLVTRGLHTLARPCKDHAKSLQSTSGIHVRPIHSATFCNNCYCCTKTHLKYEEEEKEYKHATKVVQWHEHSNTGEGECYTCKCYTKKGGRPAKGRKNHGRPVVQSCSRAVLKTHIQSIAAPKYGAKMPLVHHNMLASMD